MSTSPPYLGQTANLSLSWLSHSLLSILLLSITLSLLLGNITHLVNDGKEAFVSSCDGVQFAANVIVSLPHYMADGVNELNHKSIAIVTEGAADVLDLALFSVESIAIFIIDTYRSLFLCLLNLVVHGSLDLLIAGTAEAEAFIKLAFQDVRSELQAAISGVNTGLDDSIALLNKIPGIHITAPHASVPALNSLNNVQLPTTILTSLQSLNSSLPTLAALRDSLDSFISKPMNALRTNIKSTLGNATISIGTLPVPSKSSVSLCGNLNTSFIDDVGSTISKFTKIMLGLLALAAILLAIFNFYWERYRWKCYLASVNRAKEAWSIDMSDGITRDEAMSIPNLLAFLSASQHPRLSLSLARIARWLGLTKERKASLYWFGNYIAHPMALIFLMLGVSGLIIVEIQLGLLEGPLKGTVQGQAKVGASDFSNQVLKVVNDNMNGTSIKYANDSNTIIQDLQHGINNDLFGWVNVTTVTLNNTLNEFYTGLTNVINSTFIGTPLDTAALELIYCLIGSKVQGIETALTFIHNNAHVTLPIISSSALLLSPDRTTELTSDLTSPKGTLSTTSVVTRIVDRYAETLRKQRLGFILCILIWVLVFFMGMFGVWWRLDGERRYDEWKGRKGSSSDVVEKDKYDLRTFQLQSKTTDKDNNEAHNLPAQSSTDLNYDQPIPEFNHSNSRFDLSNFRKDLKLRNPLAGKDVRGSASKIMKGVKEISTRLKNSRGNKKDAMGNGWDKMDSQEELEASPRKRRNVEATSAPTTSPWGTTAYSSSTRLSPIRSSFHSFSSIPVLPNRNLPYSEYQLPTSSSLAPITTSTLTSIPQHPLQTPLSPPPIPNHSQRNSFGTHAELSMVLSTPDLALREGNVRGVGGRSMNPFDVPFVVKEDLNPFSTPFDGVDEE